MNTSRTILITGSSSGIGAALAQLYADHGVTLLLTGRDSNRLEDIARECRAKGAHTHTSLINVTDRDAMAQKILEWDDAFEIDLVIANAGISAGAETFFDQVMDTNLWGTFNTVNPLIPRFKQRRRGQIALMSSMAGFRGMPNAPAYSTSKVAVRAYGEALRPLLKKDGIGVSTIFPGFIKTRLTDANHFPMPFMMPAEKAALIIKKGLEKNKARIAFPWQMHLATRLVAALPLWLGDLILLRAPQKL